MNVQYAWIKYHIMYAGYTNDKILLSLKNKCWHVYLLSHFHAIPFLTRGQCLSLSLLLQRNNNITLISMPQSGQTVTLVFQIALKIHTVWMVPGIISPLLPNHLNLQWNQKRFLLRREGRSQKETLHCEGRDHIQWWSRRQTSQILCYGRFQWLVVLFRDRATVLMPVLLFLVTYHILSEQVFKVF
jgi:hypothetical protein